MPTRRDFLQEMSLVAGALTAPSVLNGAGIVPGDRVSERPNIVLILADDMGYSDIGCYGGEIATPNLDHLAAGGLRFSQFYNAPRCCPSRASLLTGLYSHQAHMGLMTSDYGRYPFPGYEGNLSKSSVTIAEALRSAGYTTLMSGKWHLTPVAETTTGVAPEDKSNWPLQRGFDRYYGILAGAANYYDPATLTRGNESICEPRTRLLPDRWHRRQCRDHAAGGEQPQ